MIDSYRECVEIMEESARDGMTAGPEGFDAAAARAHRAILAARHFPRDEIARTLIERARAARESLRRTFGEYIYLDPRAFPSRNARGHE